MIFDFIIRPVMLVNGGVLMLVLLLAQILVGMRKIKFKGRTHMKVHKWGAWTILAFAVVHGFIGMVYAFSLRIG